MMFTIVLSVSAISASDVNVTDSYATSLVDDTSDVSVPMENTADSSEISVSSDSNVDNDPSKVSLSSEEVLESEDSNILSTNSDSDNLSNSDDGITALSLSNQDEISGDVSSKIDVSKTITAKDITKYYKGSASYTATFLDANGNPLANTNVKITVNGVTYTEKTNAKGVASLAINLKPGNYKVTAKNPITGYSLTTTFTVLSTITASDISKVYTDGRKFTAKFFKSNGKVLANKKIKFEIDGQTYKVKTDSKGVASLSLVNLKKGTYKIISYNKDGLTKTNTVKVVKSTTTSLTTKDYLFLTGDSKTIKVKLLNKFGYAPGKGKIVTFKINGKTYSAKTNKNGNAKLKLPSLKAGQYIVKYKFEGNNFYKASSAKNYVTIISSKDPTFTVKSTTTMGHGANTPFKVALTSGGVPLAKKTVTLKINGNSYTKTTDNDGMVSLAINLPVGKYSITYTNKAESKLNSKTGSTTITVKERSPTTVTWKSGTSVYQGSQTFKVLLENSNKKALSGKTLKLTVNSKTYTAKTDSSGYAKFTVNVNPGNYTVSFKYEATGDNDNAPSSGTAKISVNRKTTNGYGYWLFGGDMKKVNLDTLASKGTSDIFLNYYAIQAHGKSAVESWIAKANGLGINVHIWMQTFYDGSWINPIKNGNVNTDHFNKVINDALSYAKIKGVAGIHFDYMRYPGTAYQTSGGTEAITQFIKQASTALHNYNSKLIVSCALMPETSSNEYYYGQDVEQISKYVDVIIPMIYKGNYRSSTNWIKTTTKWFVDHSNGAKVWGGLQGYKSDDDVTKLSLSEITKDSQAVLNSNGVGVIIFRWGVTNLVNFNSLTTSASSTGTLGSSDDSSSAATPATGTSTTAKTISIKNIITGATNLKNYYQNNNALPNTVTAGGVVFKLPEFLYLMSEAIYQIGNSNMKDIAYITGVSNPSSPFGDSANMQVTTENYLTWANNVAKFIKNNKQAPNYATVSDKRIVYSEVVDAFSRILAFYGTNSMLPNYVTVVTSSGGDSSISVSVTGKGVNEVNTDTSLSKYLKATTNCQVNNADIQAKATALTKGLTTDIAKAKAIFNWVRDSVSYSFYYDTKYGAVNTLKYKSANCVDHSHLLIALYRAAGLPARYVHGTCKFSSGSTYGHVWAQVLVDGKWYVADATSSRNSLGSVANWNTNSFTLKGIYTSLSF